MHQQHAATVEETNAARCNLDHRIDDLRKLLNQFRFEKHSSAKVRQVRPDVRPVNKAVASPARNIMAKAARVFGGGAARAEHWEEF
ncbi:hypothetical protein [Rhizobium halophytocola]|uniref:Uncharacterized protein n=1 Tax=Rhizobium halophytocola TaxID=735519 RepID=A0ABS4E2Q9_9HYPH|nr:hypothetical protein [Rhizobium halophytocola]MBP1852218.1 hypothetical protein [Rhizobium halophytocola]